MKVNLLVNYGWEWDLDGLKEGRLRSADIFVLDALWLDFAAQHLDTALAWFGQRDRTFGGECGGPLQCLNASIGNHALPWLLSGTARRLA